MNKEKRKKMAKIICDFYYQMNYKKEYTKENYNRTLCTIAYLIDCGFNARDIISKIKNYDLAAININDLDDSFWDKSLIKKDKYYLHNLIRIVSPAPSYDILTDKEVVPSFYCEMKIRLTSEDVLKYFYSKVDEVGMLMADEKSDAKALAYLIKKYSNIDYVDPIDIILCSIDHQMKLKPETYRLISISDNNREVIERLQKDMQELEYMNRRKVVCRNEA